LLSLEMAANNPVCNDFTVQHARDPLKKFFRKKKNLLFFKIFFKCFGIPFAWEILFSEKEKNRRAHTHTHVCVYIQSLDESLEKRNFSPEKNKIKKLQG
jgi:hypothetical protein